MEVYVLDNLLQRKTVVDVFESLIWTERFAAYGDFHLVLPSTKVHRLQFAEGTHLAMSESDRVMIVETVEDSTDDEDRHLLQIKGRSLESILENRVLKNTMDNAFASYITWYYSGWPAYMVFVMFYEMCVEGRLDSADIIPLLGPIDELNYLDGTIPAPEIFIYKQYEPDVLYNAIKDMCDSYNLGFKLTRTDSSGTAQLHFRVCTGNDRTTSQTQFNSVIFSEDLDNFQNVTELTAIEKSKNVGYVVSKRGNAKVYAPYSGSMPFTGLNRRVLVIKVDDIPDDMPQADVYWELVRRGREELTKHTEFSGFDGELSQYGEYEYNVHYKLGDIVEIRNQDGEASPRRITEQIFVSDKEGERSYPTLQTKEAIA